MAQSAPPPAVYHQSLARILTVHIPLCFILIGFYTLPVALLRRSKTRLELTDTMVRYTSGVMATTSNDIPLVRIDNLNVERSLWDRLYRTGTLVISAGGGTPTRIADLEHVEQARADLQARVAQVHARPPGT